MPESGDNTSNGGGSTGQPIARAVNVYRHFETPDGTLEVLRGIDLEVRPGQMMAIVGASGVGKSTFLHILGGLDRPTSGKVFWGNESPYMLGDEERANRRNRMVGFVFQFHHLLPEFTAEENVALPLIIGGMNRREAQERARAVLDLVGVGARGHHLPGELSGGEQQRAAVARALVTEATLLIADEPSGNLDRRTAEQLHDLLGNITKMGNRAVVVATHNPDLAGRADAVLTMRDGRLQAEDSRSPN
ncbi:MAG: ABC transporter ATP-binding protein [Candidatus Zixiibacteriota bacterium]